MTSVMIQFWAARGRPSWADGNAATRQMILNKLVIHVLRGIFSTLAELDGSQLVWAVIDDEAAVVQFSADDQVTQLVTQHAAAWGRVIHEESVCGD